MHELKLVADEFCEPFDLARISLIKSSLYKEELKSASDIATKTKLISSFVERRRNFWNFDPLNVPFCIGYQK